MPVSKEKAQSLCSTTEWNTVENSFPPKISTLKPSAAKKNANRVRRFLSKAEADKASELVAVFSEALERFLELAPKKASATRSARREKERAAREKAKELNAHRAEVREKLLKKAEEEKAEKEGEPSEDGKTKKKGNKTRGRLQAAAGASSPGRTGTRKV